MQHNLGNTPLDALLPGRGYNSATGSGWKTHTVPTGMTAQYKNAGTIVPLVGGITKLKFSLKSGRGITKFSAVGKTGSHRVGLGGSPVAVTLVANPSTNPSVQCCEMRFPGPAPAPRCTFLGGGSTLR